MIVAQNIPNHDERLRQLKAWLTESYELTKASKAEGRMHRQYYKGEQLSREVLETLKSRGQPELWINTYQMIGNKVVGYKIDTRTQVSVIGRQYEDQPKGQILGDIIRSFTDSGSAEGVEYYTEKRECDEDLMIYGLCTMEPRLRVLDQKDKRGKKLKEIEFIRKDPDTVFTDPYSKKLNYIDSRYVHTVEWVTRESLYPRYGKARVDALSASTDYIDEVKMDYDSELVLRDTITPRIPLRYTWFREFDTDKNKMRVKYAVWTDDTILELEDSPYDYQHLPIRLRRCFKGDRGEFYGMFRNLRPIQDAINYASNRVANMLGSSKLLIEEDAVDDEETFKQGYSKDNSVSVVRKGAVSGGKIKEINQADRIAQIQQRINELKQEAKNVAGFNEEALGVAVNRLSGYAIEQRQRTGLMGMMHYIDSSASFDRDVFAFAIEMIKQYFTAEQTFYIVDKQVNDRAFAINDGKNRLDIGRYDVTVEFVPIELGSRAERYKQNAEIMKILEASAPQISLDLLPEFLKDSDAPLAERAGKVIEEYKQRAAQAQNNTQVELQMKEMELRIGKLVSEIQLNQGKAAEAGMKAANMQRSMDGEPNSELEAVG
jgi:hypothetical protein